MKITIGQKAVETHDTFLLEPEVNERFHLCPYPERPGVIRVRPGDRCETNCDAVALPHGQAVPLPVVTPELILAHPFAPAEMKAGAAAMIAERDTGSSFDPLVDPFPSPVRPTSHKKSHK